MCGELYEVQTYTIRDGWVNIWQINGEPEYFEWFAEAVDALDEHLKELEEEGMPDSRENYRIKQLEKMS